MVFDGLTSTFDGDAHGRAGVARLARARDHARGAGRVGVSLAPARRRGAGRGTLRRRDRRRGRRRPPTRAIRRDTTLEKLAALKPVFDPEGTTTAGNAPGSTTVRRASSSARRSSPTRRGLEPLATILAQGYVADDFAYLARTPARAGEQALAKAGTRSTTSRASRSTRRSRRSRSNSTRMLGADEEIVNVNGGAVALGHPDRRLRRPDRRRRWCTSCAGAAAGSGSRRSAPAAGRATRS